MLPGIGSVLGSSSGHVHATKTRVNWAPTLVVKWLRLAIKLVVALISTPMMSRVGNNPNVIEISRNRN